MKQQKPKWLEAVMYFVYPLAALGLVLGIWALISFAKAKPLIFPMPDKSIADFFELLSDRAFWTATGYTVMRTLVSVLASFALAFLAAGLGGLFKPVHRVLSPIVGILRAAPTMAIILIAMIWLDGQKAPILIGFLVAFPLLYQAIYTAIVGVDSDLVEMTKVYKVSPINRVFSLYVPQIAPAVFDVTRSTVSLTLKVVIAAEVLTYAKNSIGLSMQKASLTFDVALLLAWTIVAILFSFALEGIVFGLKKIWEASR